MSGIEKVIITSDYETSKRAGAEGMFQVANIKALDGAGIEVSAYIDAGKHFSSIDEIRDELGLSEKVIIIFDESEE